MCLVNAGERVCFQLAGVAEFKVILWKYISFSPQLRERGRLCKNTPPLPCIYTVCVFTADDINSDHSSSFDDEFVYCGHSCLQKRLLWSKCEKRDDSILQPIKQLLFLPRVPFFPSLLSSFLPFTPPFSPSSRLIDSQTHCGTVRYQHRRSVFHSVWFHSPVNRQKWL